MYWKFVWFGAPDLRLVKPFPNEIYRSQEEAFRAHQEWHRLSGHYAGSEEARCNLRLVGPFKTLEDAENAEISNYADLVLS